MNEYEVLVVKMGESAIDAIKFYEKGNKAAGVRLRKFMQEVKKSAQAVRNEVADFKGK